MKLPSAGSFRLSSWGVAINRRLHDREDGRVWAVAWGRWAIALTREGKVR